MSVVEPIPALIQSRRRLASELLTAAARHSAVVDEIHDLELLKERGIANDERFTRLVEYKKFTLHKSPTTLVGMEIPSMNGKYYPLPMKSALSVKPAGCVSTIV